MIDIEYNVHRRLTGGCLVDRNAKQSNQVDDHLCLAIHLPFLYKAVFMSLSKRTKLLIRGSKNSEFCFENIQNEIGQIIIFLLTPWQRNRCIKLLASGEHVFKLIFSNIFETLFRPGNRCFCPTIFALGDNVSRPGVFIILITYLNVSVRRQRIMSLNKIKISHLIFFRKKIKHSSSKHSKVKFNKYKKNLLL